LTDGNQSLAAEPSFHSDPPRCGGFEVMTIRYFPDHGFEPDEQQPKILLQNFFLSGQPAE